MKLLLIALSFLTIALSLDSCSDDLVGHFYSDCVNGKRTAIYYYTKECDPSGHTLKPSQPNLPCPIECSPGRYLPFGKTSCSLCNSGQYSVGPGFIIDTWNDIPEVLSTNCVGNLCKVWSPQGNYITSGDNQGLNDVSSHLKYRGKFLLSNGNKIRFTYRVDGESCKSIFCDGFSFFIDDVLKIQLSHVLKWTTVEFDLTPGTHTFQWSYTKDISYEQGEDLAAIREIEFIGTQYSSESCTDCPPGHFSLGQGSSKCDMCDYNTFSNGGSSICENCPTGKTSFKGSSDCTQLKICEESDYYPLIGQCNPTTMKSKLRHAYWLGTIQVPICYPKDGISPPDEDVPCSCPPGQELDQTTGKCNYCLAGYYKNKEGGEKCISCPAKNAAVKSLYFSEWSSLPNEFATECQGDCESNGWIPMGTRIVPTLNKGEISSILTFSFTSISEDSWIEITYHNNCSYRSECNLRLFLDEETTDPESYNLASSTSTFRVKLLPGKYNCLLQYTHTTASKYARTYIKTIQVYGTSEGGATTCNPCPPGSEAANENSISCTKCKAGFYSPQNGTLCTSVPEGHFTEKDGMSYYEKCGANTISNSTHCLTDCKFSPESTGFSPIVYDLNMLNDPVNMHFAGAESTGLSYYLNLCQRQTVDGLCFGKDGVPLNTFGCQRILGQQEAVDIGHTIGFLPLEPSDIDLSADQFVLDKGLKITLTGGKYGCKVNDIGVNRETNITMICDVNAGIGTPEPRGYTAETYYRSCRYEFVWKSLYACPTCNIEDYSIVESECINGRLTKTHVKIKPCWDPQPPANEVTMCRACPQEEGMLTCSGKGVCDLTSGNCLCGAQWTGTNCEECKPGFYGLECNSTCLGGAENPCHGHGSCSSGTAGTGICNCTTGWTGEECNSCDIGYEGPDCTVIPATITEVFPWWSFIIPVVVLVAAAILGFTLWKQKRQIENRYRSLENNNPIQLDDDIPVSFPVSDTK